MGSIVFFVMIVRKNSQEHGLGEYFKSRWKDFFDP